MRGVIIAVPERKEHAEQARQWALKQGIDMKVVDAVDGRDPSVAASLLKSASLLAKMQLGIGRVSHLAMTWPT